MNLKTVLLSFFVVQLSLNAGCGNSSMTVTGGGTGVRGDGNVIVKGVAGGRIAPEAFLGSGVPVDQLHRALRRRLKAVAEVSEAAVVLSPVGLSRDKRARKQMRVFLRKCRKRS